MGTLNLSNSLAKLDRETGAVWSPCRMKPTPPRQGRNVTLNKQAPSSNATNKPGREQSRQSARIACAHPVSAPPTTIPPRRSLAAALIRLGLVLQRRLSAAATNTAARNTTHATSAFRVTNVVSSEAFQNASSTSRNPAEVDVQSRGSRFTVLRKDARKHRVPQSAHHSTAAARQQVTQHPGGGPTSIAYSAARRPSVQEPTAPAL